MNLAFTKPGPVSGAAHRFAAAPSLAGILMLALAGCAGPAALDSRPVTTTEIEAGHETPPVTGADVLTPALWIDESNPANSLIVAAGDGEQLHVYSIAGEPLHSVELGRFNDLAAVGRVHTESGPRALFVATDASRSRLALLTVAPDSGQPDPAPLEIEGLDVEPVGVCATSLISGVIDLFVISADGELIRYSVSVPRFGEVSVHYEARLDLGTAVADCVADRERDAVWFTQPGSGIWQLPLRMDQSSRPEPVARLGSAGLPFAPDGLALVRGSGRALLVAASPADDSFIVYTVSSGRIAGGHFRVLGEYPLKQRFRVAAGNDIDAVSGGRRLDGDGVSGLSGLPGGLLVVHDAGDQPGSGTNLKIVALDELLGSM